MSWGCNFYGVNTMPNLFLWNSLYPYNYSTSYGGGVQFNTLPMTYSPAEAFAIHNGTNPFYNVNQMFNNFAQMLNPYQNQQNLLIQQSAYAFGQNIGNNIGLDNRFNTISGNLTNLEGSIDYALSSDKLTDDQKNKLNKIKQKLEELKTKLTNASDLRRQGATLEQLNASLDIISGEYTALKKQVETLAEQIKKQLEESNRANGKAEGTPAEETPAEENGSVGQVTAREVSGICKEIFNAIDGGGTNYDSDTSSLKSTMQKINADNVLDVIALWDKAYSELDDFKDDEKGFIESLMDDCGGSQKEEISEYLISALEDCARKKGIDVDKELATARDAIKANWLGWRDNDKICDAVNDLITKVKGE